MTSAKSKSCSTSSPRHALLGVLSLSARQCAPEPMPTVSNCINEDTIGARTDDSDGRIPRTYGPEERKRHEKHTEHDVGPCVERPLPGPVNRPSLGERSEVVNRPNVVNARPT